MIEFVKLYVYHVVGADTLRKQIVDINKVLKTVLSRLLREGSHYDTSYIRICQHMLGAPRAAHCQELWHLASARLLRELDDDDLVVVKQTKNKQLPLIWDILFGIPAAISFITSDYISDVVKEWIPPLLVAAFLFINAALFNSSPYAVAIPYCVFIVAVIYLYAIYFPSKKRLAISKSTGIKYSNTLLCYFDNTVIFFTFSGLKKFLCKKKKVSISPIATT